MLLRSNNGSTKHHLPPLLKWPPMAGNVWNRCFQIFSTSVAFSNPTRASFLHIRKKPPKNGLSQGDAGVGEWHIKEFISHVHKRNWNRSETEQWLRPQGFPYRFSPQKSFFFFFFFLMSVTHLLYHLYNRAIPSEVLHLAPLRFPSKWWRCVHSALTSFQTYPAARRQK